MYSPSLWFLISTALEWKTRSRKNRLWPMGTSGSHQTEQSPVTEEGHAHLTNISAQLLFCFHSSRVTCTRPLHWAQTAQLYANRLRGCSSSSSLPVATVISQLQPSGGNVGNFKMDRFRATDIRFHYICIYKPPQYKQNYGPCTNSIRLHLTPRNFLAEILMQHSIISDLD